MSATETPPIANDAASAHSLDRMVLRWTPEQRERAWAIVNDIAEDIDNGESRAELRQALAIYADHLCDALQAKADERSVKMMEAIEKLDALLKTQNTD
jgi:hypothetical protein